MVKVEILIDELGQEYILTKGKIYKFCDEM